MPSPILETFLILLFLYFIYILLFPKKTNKKEEPEKQEPQLESSVQAAKKPVSLAIKKELIDFIHTKEDADINKKFRNLTCSDEDLGRNLEDPESFFDDPKNDPDDPNNDWPGFEYLADISPYRKPALLYAMDSNSVNPLVSKLLYDRMQDRDLITDFGFHIIHAAAKSDEFFEILKQVADHVDDIDLVNPVFNSLGDYKGDGYSDTALSIAVARRNLRAVKYLLSKGADPKVLSCAAMRRWCRGTENNIHEHKGEDARLNYHHYMKDRSLEPKILDELISNGASIDDHCDENLTPLQLVIYAWNFPREPTYLRPKDYYFQKAQALIAKGCDVNKKSLTSHRGYRGCSALHICEKINQIRLLNDHNVDLSARDESQNNLLHYLAALPSLDSEELDALEKEINIEDLKAQGLINHKNEIGVTPQDILASNDKLSYIQKAKLEAFLLMFPTQSS